ncbi:MAG: hypothetical protein L6R28_07225 [Planctomycetes bacterium]|nr:hypothetical protein [Planctomycetota bacterium]
MTSVELAVLLAGVLIVALLWINIFLLIPGFARSRTRYKLWEIRDKIADERYEGQLPSAPPTESLINEIEGTINCVNNLTVANLLCWRLALRRELLEPSDPENFSSFSEQQLERFEKYKDDYLTLCAHHALFWSPSGMLLMVLAISLSPVILLIHFFCGLRDRCIKFLDQTLRTVG